MRTPTEQLAAIAISHIDDAPEARRPELLEAAAAIFAAQGSHAEAEQLKTTAALQRTASEAQRSLAELFKPQPSTSSINGVPHQSLNSRFPGISLAAADLGVTRAHLWAVLNGRRDSKPLLSRWNEWLKNHPEFAALQPLKRK